MWCSCGDGWDCDGEVLVGVYDGVLCEGGDGGVGCGYVGLWLCGVVWWDCSGCWCWCVGCVERGMCKCIMCSGLWCGYWLLGRLIRCWGWCCDNIISIDGSSIDRYD